MLLISAQACNDPKGQKQEPVFKQVSEIQEIKPERPAKIKLKRDAKDDHSWEISGDDVDEIIRVDKKLRKDLKAD
jgi:hypothetical protein